MFQIKSRRLEAADLVSIGQKIKVKITKIDEKTNRVSTSVSFN